VLDIFQIAELARPFTRFELEGRMSRPLYSTFRYGKDGDFFNPTF
jgi:hypothetical protein